MDHLGIAAMVCREIDLVGEINQIVGVDPRQKVTCGEAVVAMVLNALRFVGSLVICVEHISLINQANKE